MGATRGPHHAAWTISKKAEFCSEKPNLESSTPPLECRSCVYDCTWLHHQAAIWRGKYHSFNNPYSALTTTPTPEGGHPQQEVYPPLRLHRKAVIWRGRCWRKGGGIFFSRGLQGWISAGTSGRKPMKIGLRIGPSPANRALFAANWRSMRFPKYLHHFFHKEGRLMMSP